MKRWLLLGLLAACPAGGNDKTAERPTPVETGGGGTAPAAPGSRAYTGPPVAAVNNVKDTYHGVTVDDPYRWLEGNDASVQSWIAGQNAYSKKFLETLPGLDELRTELNQIYKAPITYYGGVVAAGGKYFAYRRRPDAEQVEIVMFDDPSKAGEAKLVLDPTAGGSTRRSIDWFYPSKDGKKLAVSLSENGSEAGALHVFDLEGKELDAVIPGVQNGTGGGSLAWTPDNKGFYYTRYPRAGEKPDNERQFWMQVWFHELGKADDRYEIGKDFPKIAEVVLETDKRGRVLAKVQNGDGHEFRHYLRDTKGAWHQLDDWKDQIVAVNFGSADELWIVSNADAPRGKVLRLPATATSMAGAKVVVPQGADSIVTEFLEIDWGVVDGGDRIFITYQTGGPTELRAFTKLGKPAKAPALPPVASSNKPLVVGTTTYVAASSYTTPRTFYRFDHKTAETTPIAALSPKPPVDLSSVEVIRETATSKDGTKVPFTVMWPKGAPRDGSVPCLASGYGGYGLSETPGFSLGDAPLLARGICVVNTNLRGGAEFGEEWHRAGMLTKKQNVFDDFSAVLQALVDRKLTRPDRLAILGGSNGGLLMGAMLTQHPQQMKAVVSLVGIYDSVRAEQSANGEYNITEFGTVKDKAQFEAIHAYSPYHHVAQASYPAVLMTTGDNDARVPPWHSRKMIAALQAAQIGDAPIVLKTSSTAGHGAGTALSERIESSAQWMAFVLSQIKK